MDNSRSDVEANSQSDVEANSHSFGALRICCGRFLFLLLVVLVIVWVAYLPAICFIHNRPDYVNIDEVQANFTTTSRTNETLTYNLDLSISLRNSNKHYRVHHHKIEAMTYYNNPATGFGTAASLNSFSQKPKSNALLTPSFKGLINLGDDHEVYILVVKLDLENNYATLFLGWEATSKFECDLKVPTINGQSPDTTTSTGACKGLNDFRTFPVCLKTYFFYMVVLASTPVWLTSTLPIGYFVAPLAAFLWLLLTV